MEDAFLDSYWESLNDVQEPYADPDPWVTEGELFLSQWD